MAHCIGHGSKCALKVVTFFMIPIPYFVRESFFFDFTFEAVIAAAFKLYVERVSYYHAKA